MKTCKHEKILTIKEDEQPLFQVNYCNKCDKFIDGFGIPVQFEMNKVLVK